MIKQNLLLNDIAEIIQKERRNKKKKLRIHTETACSDIEQGKELILKMMNCLK